MAKQNDKQIVEIQIVGKSAQGCEEAKRALVALLVSIAKRVESASSEQEQKSA